MSRRVRALGFGALALLAAVLAAVLANGYGSRAAGGYGPLREVVVTNGPLNGGRPLPPGDVAAALETRRVPVRFVPAGALRSPAEALGLAPVADLPAGSYLLAAQLAAPERHGAVGAALGSHRRPVEIAVSGAEALLATGEPAAGGTKVDVVVTTEPSTGGPGRTYVAAAKVPLLRLGPGADGSGPGGLAAATLALTKKQALRLIAAESFARKLTLLPEG